MFNLRNRQVPRNRLDIARRGRGQQREASADSESGDEIPVPLAPPAEAQEARRFTFKEIKTATEAIRAGLPKYTGESDEDTFGQWLEKFVHESNSLNLGRRLSLMVFPRMLSGSARIKYDSLPVEDRADFTRAAEALAEKLRSRGGRDKAMNDLSSTKMKPSETMVKFAKRVQGVARVAFPALREEQRADMIINRFIHGLPARIKMKVLERETPETIDEAIRVAERMEEILKEEDNETINLINNVRKNYEDEGDESLIEQIENLKIESRRQRELIEQIAFNNQSQFNHTDQPYEFSDYEENQQNDRDDSYQSIGWQPNRAPGLSGIHFLMIVACLALNITGASANEVHSFGLQKAIMKNHEMLQFNLIINPCIILEMRKDNITSNDIGIQWGDYKTLDKLHREPRAPKRGDTIIAGIASMVAVEITSGKLVTLHGNQINGMVHSPLVVEKTNSIGQSTLMATEMEEKGLQQLQREFGVFYGEGMDPTEKECVQMEKILAAQEDEKTVPLGSNRKLHIQDE